MTDVRTTLGAHRFFAGLEGRHLDTLAGLATPAVFAPHTWIARAGEPAQQFHAVVAGRAGIELAPPGRRPLVVATVHDGDVLGWSWWVEPHRWTFDVLALDEVTTLAFDADALRAACAADHELGYQLGRRLTQVVAGRLAATRHQLMDVYGRDH